MNIEQLYTIIIAATPAITSIIAIVAAVASAIKKFKKVDGSLDSIKSVATTLSKENAELKKELKQVYKLHSELVQHIAYTDHDKENCSICNKKESKE